VFWGVREGSQAGSSDAHVIQSPVNFLPTAER